SLGIALATFLQRRSPYVFCTKRLSCSRKLFQDQRHRRVRDAENFANRSSSCRRGLFVRSNPWIDLHNAAAGEVLLSSHLLELLRQPNWLDPLPSARAFRGQSLQYRESFALDGPI